MNKKTPLTLSLSFACALFSAAHISQAQELDKLGIAAITPTPSTKVAVEKAGKTLTMGQVVESLDSQLIHSFNTTKKFRIVAVSDLKEIVKAQERSQSGNYDANDPMLPTLFKLAGAKFHIITTVDGFQDVPRTDTFAISKEVVNVREITLSAVGKIYNTETGILLESANFQISATNVVEESITTKVDGNRSDKLLVVVSRRMADQIANRVTDVVFPAQVMAKKDKQIIIDRGQGTGVAKGQIWHVFDKEDFLLGKVRIVSVQPKNATAEILEGTGIEKGAILRLPEPE